MFIVHNNNQVSSSVRSGMFCFSPGCRSDRAEAFYYPSTINIPAPDGAIFVLRRIHVIQQRAVCRQMKPVADCFTIAEY